MTKFSVAALLGAKSDLLESVNCIMIRKEGENSVVNDHEVCVALVICKYPRFSFLAGRHH